jgi:hypothetical protein
MCKKLGKSSANNQDPKDDVKYRIDPFAREIHNKIIYKWLCNDCEFLLCMEI